MCVSDILQTQNTAQTKKLVLQDLHEKLKHWLTLITHKHTIKQYSSYAFSYTLIFQINKPFPCSSPILFSLRCSPYIIEIFCVNLISEFTLDGVMYHRHYMPMSYWVLRQPPGERAVPGTPCMYHSPLIRYHAVTSLVFRPPLLLIIVNN